MSPSSRPLIPIRCELCGGPMKLVRRMFAPDAQSQMALYQCEKRGHTVTRPVQGDE